MSTALRLAGSLLALGATVGIVTVTTQPSTVLECVDTNGRRLAWADSERECPTGTTPEKRELVDVCDPASCMPCDPYPCEPGSSGCPDPVPVEYLCCEQVCGEQACEWIGSASQCSADNLIWECDCPYQQPSGDIECMAC